MSSMQQWEVLHGHVHPVGRHAPRTVKILVLASDAEAAVIAARAEEFEAAKAAAAVVIPEAYRKGQRDMLAMVDAVLAAIPTPFWINASTGEAQEHKRSVRAAVLGLLPDGGSDD